MSLLLLGLILTCTCRILTANPATQWALYAKKASYLENAWTTKYWLGWCDKSSPTLLQVSHNKGTSSWEEAFTERSVSMQPLRSHRCCGLFSGQHKKMTHLWLGPEVLWSLRLLPQNKPALISSSLIGRRINRGTLKKEQSNEADERWSNRVEPAEVSTNGDETVLTFFWAFPSTTTHSITLRRMRMFELNRSMKTDLFCDRSMVSLWELVYFAVTIGDKRASGPSLRWVIFLCYPGNKPQHRRVGNRSVRTASTSFMFCLRSISGGLVALQDPRCSIGADERKELLVLLRFAIRS